MLSGLGADSKHLAGRSIFKDCETLMAHLNHDFTTH